MKKNSTQRATNRKNLKPHKAKHIHCSLLKYTGSLHFNIYTHYQPNFAKTRSITRSY